MPGTPWLESVVHARSFDREPGTAPAHSLPQRKVRRGTTCGIPSWVGRPTRSGRDVRGAVFDNVGGIGVGVSRSVGSRHCLRGHPRAARRGEGASRLRRLSRTRGCRRAAPARPEGDPDRNCEESIHPLGGAHGVRADMRPQADTAPHPGWVGGPVTRDQQPATGGRGIQHPESSIPTPRATRWAPSPTPGTGRG